jgi:hypothetical protein
VTNYGNVVVAFNPQIIVPGNIKLIDSEVLDLSIIPGVSSVTHNKDLQITSWNVTSKLQMSFNQL